MKFPLSALLASAVFCLCLPPASLRAESPAEERLQGLYEGEWKEGEATAKAEARVVAMGGGAFKLLVRREVDGAVTRAEIDGKLADGALVFEGNSGGVAWKAKCREGVLDGMIGDAGSLAAKRVERKSPTLGKKPPEGAVVLLDGKNFENMTPEKGAWPPVDDADGSIAVPQGGMRSKTTLEGGFDAHVEFRCNFKPEARGQGRGNSGFFLPNGDEIQVLDSFGTGTYLGGGCGGLYRFKDPDAMEPIPSMEGQEGSAFTLASLPPLEWQTYDVEYRVRPDAGGNPAVALTLYHNGIKVHDAVALKHRPGVFQFQDHGNPVRYRNLWVLERKNP